MFSTHKKQPKSEQMFSTTTSVVNLSNQNQSNLQGESHYESEGLGHSFGQISVFPKNTVMVQPKLSVNTPGDKYEQEADSVAEQVMRMTEPNVQRKCDKCEEEEKNVIQTKAQDSGGSIASPTLGHQINQTSGNGHPLDGNTRTFMESRFGADFNHVRIHTGSTAESLNTGLNARAFTHGSDIYFNRAQYNPASLEGKKLLAHELTHVVQQRSNITPKRIQRELLVQNPGVAFINDATNTNAQIVESWLDMLSPTGQWSVDAATGVVSSPIRNDFCNARKPKVGPHRSVGTPVSSECICNFTDPGSLTVNIHAENFVALPSGAFDINAAGEGRTRPPDPPAGRPEANVGVSGRDPNTIQGAGDTSPHAGIERSQTIRDPPWIILGHELCGHVRKGQLPHAGHASTPSINETAIDIENRIRREHSTIADNFGLRLGEFTDSMGNSHHGSVYKVHSGETLSAIAVKVGISVADMLNHIWRDNGNAITAADQSTIRANERLLIENVYWHQVISGESMTSIADMWDVPLTSLTRANPSIADPNKIRPGQILLIPNT